MPKKSQHQEDIKIGKKLVERITNREQVKMRYRTKKRVESLPARPTSTESYYIFNPLIKDGWGDDDAIFIDRTKKELPKKKKQEYIPDCWEELVDNDKIIQEYIPDSWEELVDN